MKLLKKALTGLFLTLGSLILVLGIIDITDSTLSNEEKQEVLAAIIILGLPSMGMGTYLLWNLNQENQRNIKQLDLEREQLFLQLLQQQGGKITVTQFALAVKVSIKDAQQYLDRKAHQMGASFETTDEGGIIYKFPL
ncbi:MAG: hypothetical protein SW833_19535 [Cyanobacteriota bacterium]|nr:hypothetical protein [Cyanobacteriota bacterium]